MHVTQVYFMQLDIKIKYVEFDDNSIFYKKKPENVKVFLLEDWQKNFLPKNGKYEHWTTFSESYERTVMIDFKMCCLYVVLVLPGSVETQLG